LAQLIMTPIIFVSFLVSLAWVDFKYYSGRVHDHESRRSRMPALLHQILFRPQPYEYVRVQASSTELQADSASGERWYYHTNQRKLMKMEVTDAFRIRGTVLAFLAAVVAVSLWLLYHGMLWTMKLWSERTS
jgi:hypothetical protein